MLSNLCVRDLISYAKDDDSTPISSFMCLIVTCLLWATIFTIPWH